MPVILNDISQSTNVMKSYDPKFFSSQLTGSGKKIGALCEQINPKYLSQKNPKTLPINIGCIVKKRKYTNGLHQVTEIPIKPNLYKSETPFDMEEIMKTYTKICENTTTKLELYANLSIDSIIIDKEEKQGKAITSVHPIYAVHFVWCDKNQPAKRQVYTDINDFLKNQIASYHTIHLTLNPNQHLNSLVSGISKLAFNVNQSWYDIIDTFDVFENVVQQAVNWNGNLPEIYKPLFEHFSDKNTQNPIDKTKLVILKEIVRYLENYNIPLGNYAQIYKSLSDNFQTKTLQELCKHNLNLLLTDTLNNLKDQKSTIAPIPNPNTQIVLDPKFSVEQQKAIKTEEPLALVQAGAGTGKSTVILNRVDFLQQRGVDPKDITVISFTNAAADNITLKNPNVNSMTIAKMIHEIYTLNFKNHNLSTIETICNTIEIMFPRDNVAQMLKGYLYKVGRTERGAFTETNQFIENNFDRVIEILNTLEQTTLELEIIICYQKIHELKEPDHVTSQYLIIDEVQDNSIFEFIYVLKYVEKHKEHLYLVGDASQTLYEFRASNPKALNTLESSGVFATFQLQTNYRSNQAILDFANVLLERIDANQFAKIQLMANDLTPISEKFFKNAVTLNYCQIAKAKELNEALTAIMVNEVRPYIENKLNANEKIAFIAYKRETVNVMENVLKTLFPNANILNLIPDRAYSSTIFTTFIRKYWDMIKFSPSMDIVRIIIDKIVDNLDFLTKSSKEKILPFVRKMLADWAHNNANTIHGWQTQVVNKQLSVDEFMKLVKENMIAYERDNNAIKQSLSSAKNEANKSEEKLNQANFILSTIHSAKGLEFDNVITVYEYKSDMTEENKRMYYVALTRAKKSEYVIAFGNVVKPKIQADYKSICERLADKDLQNTTITNNN